MKRPPLPLRALALLCLVAPATAPPVAAAEAAVPIALVIHGGAGTIRRADLTADEEAAYRAKLSEALQAGFALLRDGGASLDAVEAAIRVLEDSPLFNAGKGAVFTAEGRNELDASIMEGHTRRAGAVAGLTVVKNPISAARAVMERTEHVLLAGDGADQFAGAAGLETVDPSYFWTERRWRALERARDRERVEDAAESGVDGRERYLGTVGAVALDRRGRLAAGTSTGGMTNKKHGRVGDSPIIGAGTWADHGCGVSSTGHGEYFIRYAVAADICARAHYRGISVEEAAREVVLGTLREAGGSGGVIALDSEGRPALVFNSEGMYRGWIGADGTAHVAIYR